jgi:hypothetical protein
LVYSSPNPWRYIFFDLPNVSYAEAELLKAKDPETEEKFVIKNIRDERKVKGKYEYLVHWKGYLLVKDSTWESKEQLIEDGSHEYMKMS